MSVARIAVLLAVLGGGTARAETLTTYPERLTIEATKGNVLVRDVAVKGATSWTTQVMPFSTVNGAQQDVDALSIERVTANGMAAVRLTITLDGTESGEYRTEILVRDGAGNVTRVPVEVSVKAWWVLPLVLLVVGAGIGFAMSYYRTYRQARDEILERLGVMRERLATVVVDVFRAEIEKNLTIANEAVRDKKWTNATNALDASDAILLRYREHAADWKRVVDYAAELEQRIDRARATGTETHRRSLLDAIATIRRGAVQAAAPSAVTAALTPFRVRVRRYLELDEILVDDFPEVKAWRKKLDSLGIEDDKGAEKLVENIIAATSVPENVQFEAPEVDIKAVPETTDAEIVAGRRARRRRDIAFFIGLAVGFVALAAGGFNQLYLQNATFGGVWDHVMIGLWGLGSAAVPSSVASPTTG